MAFVPRRPGLKEAEERYDGDYFLANRSFMLEDGRPDLFSYMMPRILFFWALGFYGFRPTIRRSLDIGCGVGILPRYFQFLGYEAHGVEISRWAVDYGRRVLGLEHLHCGTVESAGYADASFDVVTVVHVLEHLNDPIPVLQEARRLLADDGWLYVEVPSSEHDPSDYLNDQHVWFYGRDSLRRLLSCSGFHAVNVGAGTFDKRLHNVPFVFASARPRP